MTYRYPVRGYFQECCCCGAAFGNAPGARAYLRHLSQSTYYGVRMSPEATWALGAKAREFLKCRCGCHKGRFAGLLGETQCNDCGCTDAGLGKMSFKQWVSEYYFGWKPAGPDIIPAAYGWFIP